MLLSVVMHDSLFKRQNKEYSKWCTNLVYYIFKQFWWYSINSKWFVFIHLNFLIYNFKSYKQLVWFNSSPSNILSGNASELISSLVNTELKYSFETHYIFHYLRCFLAFLPYLESSVYTLHKRRNYCYNLLCHSPILIKIWFLKFRSS